MPDNLTTSQRRRCMQSIRSRDTHPEILTRRFLHRLGFRFRLHAENLSGKPDIVLPRFKTAIFVHGCFWHNHTCSRAFLPKTRTDYWIPKLVRTRKRDIQSAKSLKKDGWTVITLWECEVENYRTLAKRCRSLFLLREKLSRESIRLQKASNRAI